jgi:nucleoside-diphosphate-sugar epimerase
VRVLLVGSTGVIGRAAVPALLAAGHEVTGLARNADRAGAVRALGIEPVVADLFDVESMVAALRGREAVLNVASRIPTGPGALTERGWAANNRVREQGSATLVEAALRTDDVGVIVQEGISYVYADGGDAELDETAPIEPYGPLLSSVTAHRNVERFAAAGRTGVRLRIAALQGDDPITRMLLGATKLRLPMLPGPADAWFTAIHPDDAGSGAAAALGAPSGIYNVGAAPARKGEFARVLAEAAGVRRARLLPNRLGLGPAATFRRSQRVVSRKLAEATGWTLRHPAPAASWYR